MDQESVMDIVKEFKMALESEHIEIEQLILYGSHAEGKAKEESDIDVVVISSSFSDKNYSERIDILTEAIYKIFEPIEASAFTPDEWKSNQSLLVDYAKNGILIQ